MQKPISTWRRPEQNYKCNQLSLETTFCECETKCSDMKREISKNVLIGDESWIHKH